MFEKGGINLKDGDKIEKSIWERITCKGDCICAKDKLLENQEFNNGVLFNFTLHACDLINMIDMISICCIKKMFTWLISHAFLIVLIEKRNRVKNNDRAAA